MYSREMKSAAKTLIRDAGIIPFTSTLIHSSVMLRRAANEPARRDLTRLAKRA